MAKKKPNQITIAAILAIAAILFLSYLSHTGYATIFRQTMGERSGPDQPSISPPTGVFRPACTESCAIKTVTLYVGQQTTFCCDVIELRGVNSNGDIIVTVTDGFKLNKDYSVFADIL